MPGFEQNGYVYERSRVVDEADIVITEDQAQAEISAFSKRISELFTNCKPEKWSPYVQNEYLDQESQAALNGLRGAVEHFATRASRLIPIAIMRESKDGGRRALVGDLVPKKGMESWHRKTDRGVTAFSAVLFFSKEQHHVILGDQVGLIDVDATAYPKEQELPVDRIEYLPNIDGSTNYTVRHTGLLSIAIGDAVFSYLRENDLQHVWEKFLTSSHN